MQTAEASDLSKIKATIVSALDVVLPSTWPMLCKHGLSERACKIVHEVLAGAPPIQQWCKVGNSSTNVRQRASRINSTR